MLRAFLTLLWVATALSATAAGMGYYLTPLQERPFSESHALFASFGLVGHAYGILGAAFMVVGVGMYSARRRLAPLAKVGKLKDWLQIHIFLCTLGPFLVVLHSALRVGGLVAISFWSMVLVVVSGVFGRYLYVRIPKSLQGNFVSLEALQRRREEAFSRLRERAPVNGAALALLSKTIQPEEPRSLSHALVIAFRWDAKQRRRKRTIRRLLDGMGGSEASLDEVMRLAEEEARLGSQVALLQPFRRMFRYWHVFHLPLAIVMFLILAVHVAVAILFGYAWVL